MSFDGREEGRKRSVNERKKQLIARRESLFHWLASAPHTLENRIVRNEVWEEMRDIERQLDALNVRAFA